MYLSIFQSIYLYIYLSQATWIQSISIDYFAFGSFFLLKIPRISM